MAYIHTDEPLSECCGERITSLELCGNCSEPTGPHIDEEEKEQVIPEYAVMQAAARFAGGMFLAFLIVIAAAFVILTPDERVTGWMSNDAGMEVTGR